MKVKAETADNSYITATITRRSFVKIGGALFVSALLPPGISALAAESRRSTGSDASGIVAGNSQRQYDRGAHRPNGNGHRDERILCAGDCGRAECAARNDFADSGRHGQDAGRRLLRRFPERNEQPSESRGVYAPSAVGTGGHATRCSGFRP